MVFLKIGIAATVIWFASWLSGKKPELAGFIIALPIASLLALAFSYIEYKDAAASITFAKNILIGVPVSWLFFIPFFFADRLGGNFWLCYGIGIALLVLGFFIHRYLSSLF
ncbi:hypothetical protein [Nitrosomonas communis]|uniref:DUF3147 family protein n=1 Tax=Nitrosomonas communis TaxID=44574 RepID=A0A1I4MN00_9PROT|nr:hypothetical protein [Nitrosomonas communis]SFM04651.1 hypothetical protein SAMN05421863_10115 [Nitrosomonas communis]